MKQILKSYSKPERVTMPGGLKKRVFACGCVSLIVLLCTLQTSSAVVAKSGGYSGGGVSSSQIRRLITEKQQKYAQLEQCTKKVNGFKIAGISTLGLTAVGIGGNVALASKNKKLERDINDTRTKIEEEQKKKADIEAKIKEARAEKRKANQTSESECANITGATWKNDKCVCDDEKQVIKGTECVNKITETAETFSGDRYPDKQAWKSDCLAHSDIAEWHEADNDDDFDDCKCKENGKLFYLGQCLSLADVRKRCLDTGGAWDSKVNDCDCATILNKDEEDEAVLSYHWDFVSLWCELNQDVVDKYGLKQDSDGYFYPKDYFEGNCFNSKSNHWICTGTGNEEFWLDVIAENQLYDVDDRSLLYIPDGTCVELANPDEKVCVVDGRFIRNACQAAGAKEYTEDKGICLGCPDNKVFFDAKCMTIKEAEQKCKNSGGDFEKKTMNSKPYALCECDYTLSALYDVSCTTKANREKWGPLMWYAE